MPHSFTDDVVNEVDHIINDKLTVRWMLLLSLAAMVLLMLFTPLDDALMGLMNDGDVYRYGGVVFSGNMLWLLMVLGLLFVLGMMAVVLPCLLIAFFVVLARRGK